MVVKLPERVNPQQERGGKSDGGEPIGWGVVVGTVDLRNLNVEQEKALQEVLKICRTLAKSRQVKMADIFFVELAKLVGQKWQEFEKAIRK